MGTGIAWTDETWNPVTGCTKVSAGCKNCYAERMAKRLRGRFGYPADEPFRVTLRPDRLDQPTRWRKPRMIFVCSMSDLFHEDVGFDKSSKIIRVMQDNPRHTFQVLTKRPERMNGCILAINEVGYILGDRWPLPNVWLGVTAENQATADERIPLLLQTPAAVRFVSVEPMLGPESINWALDYQCGHPCDDFLEYGSCHCTDWHDSGIRPLWNRLDWAIIGCESGPDRRPMELDWARSLVDQCKTAGVPVFVKQLPINGKVSHDPAEWPEDLRVREFPQEAR